ncbi:DEAD/DEAH box helicase [Dermabacteraceae bacterium CCM 9519]
MPIRRLHLCPHGATGAALWARESVGDGRSRAVSSLDFLTDTPLGGAADFTGPLRTRVTLEKPAGRRVPALPLAPSQLVAFLGLSAQAMADAAGIPAPALRSGADFPPALCAHLDALSEQGQGCELGPELYATAELVRGVRALARSRAAVKNRLVVPHIEIGTAAPTLGLHRLSWVPAPGTDSELASSRLSLRVLDAEARRAFARFAEHEAPAPAFPLLAALSGDDDVWESDVPAAHRAQLALSEMIAAAHPVTLLEGGEAPLVRLSEPGGDGLWPLEVCLRQRSGTVHPLADVRAAGDITAAAAASLVGDVLRLAPGLHGARLREETLAFFLTLPQASTFLEKQAERLEAGGIAVMLPRDWTKTPVRLRAEVQEAKSDEEGSQSGIGVQAMARFDWGVSVGETQLTEEEIAQLKEEQAELVYLRGRWVRLDGATLRAASRFLERAARGGTRPLRELFAVMASREASGVDFAPPVSVTEDGAARVDDAAACGSASALPGEPTPIHPRTLHATLRPYQERGVSWLAARDYTGWGTILADDMGLGKTIQLLALLCHEREPGTDSDADSGASTPREVGPTLLIAPMSLAGNWQREAARFAPHLRCHVHHGPQRGSDPSAWEGADLVVSTYSLLARDLPLLSQTPWRRVVFDEAQHLKNPGTAVSRAAKELPAETKIALTGTPVENRLQDLHSLMETVNPGLLGDAASFAESLANPIEKQRDEAALARLQRVTGPFILRRLKTDRSIISDLPEKQEMTLSASLTPEQAALYEAIVKEMLIELDGSEPAQRRAAVVGALTRLKQVCNHPAHYLGDGSPILAADGSHRSGKIALVDDLLENIFAAGERALLFTQFTTFGQMMRGYWQERHGLAVPFLHGGSSKDERDAMVADFQGGTDGPGALLLSLKAGGTGLTLTRANHVIHLDRWWNPAVENQATDRAYRIGQDRNVQVRKLVSAGTVEEKIDDVLTGKAELAEMTVRSGENWLAQLPSERLAEVFALDRGKIA